jgi:hypothetical protein
MPTTSLDKLGPAVAQAGVVLPVQSDVLNFATGATATYNPATGQTDIVVSGGGGGGGGQTFTLSGSSAALISGDWVALSPADITGLTVTKAIPGAIAVAGGVLGVVAASYSPSATGVVVVTQGTIGNAISSLGSGAAGKVGINSSARAARVAYPTGGEYYIGQCDTSGNVVIAPLANIAMSPKHVFNVLAYGAKGDCVDHNVAGATNDTAAFERAMSAAAGLAVDGVYPYNNNGVKTGEIYVPPLPLGRSYFLGGYGPNDPHHPYENHSALDIQQSLDLNGSGGGQGQGSKITLGPGLSIRTYPQSCSPGGGNSGGCLIRNLEIWGSGFPAGAAAWQPNHSYCVGDKMFLHHDYRFWYECVVAGVSAASPTITISSISVSTDNKVTIITSSPHGRATDDWLVFSGISGSGATESYMADYCSKFDYIQVAGDHQRRTFGDLHRWNLLLRVGFYPTIGEQN